VAVEAGVSLGWEKYVGMQGGLVTMNRFGASAPAAELYAQFGITPDAVVAAVLAQR
jgi:transketolase